MHVNPVVWEEVSDRDNQRHQQQPPAFYTPKKGGKKVSIYLWLHTSLDVLWLINGVVFVVLLFVTGHWARIVPTSWEVFPNALSAMLQYLTLEWPVENGWVNYNSLQQLAYFSTVFLAAPLAIASGFRMSGLWPKKNAKLAEGQKMPERTHRSSPNRKDFLTGPGEPASAVC